MRTPSSASFLFEGTKAHNHRFDFSFRQLIFLEQSGSLYQPILPVLLQTRVFALKFIAKSDEFVNLGFELYYFQVASTVAVIGGYYNGSLCSRSNWEK